MENFSDYISPKRRSLPTPNSVIDKTGHPNFGTFDKEFTDLNLLDVRSKLPRFIKKLRLTLWEAFEVHLEGGLLVCGLADMGAFIRVVHVFYDFKEDRIYSFGHNFRPSKGEMAENLLDGSTTSLNVNKTLFRIVNRLENGEAILSGHDSDSKNGYIKYSFDAKSISKPSVVCIPFGKNKPLYTEKIFFSVNGKMTINDKVYKCGSKDKLIIDDHRGYYPYRAHYDWYTFLGVDSEGNDLGINLTRNQSVNQKDYNENLIWRKGFSSLLPPVTFIKEGKIRRFKSEKKTPLIWHIQDDEGMVDLHCSIKAVNKTITQALVCSIHYYIVFGRVIHGYVIDESGHKYDMAGTPFIGEDKTLRF